MTDDDFLHQLRTRPSPVFAARLKAKLDRQNHRRTYALMGCIAVLAAGGAIAMAIPKVRHWLSANAVQVQSNAGAGIPEVPAPTSGAPAESTQSSLPTPASAQLAKTPQAETQTVTGNTAASTAGGAPSNSPTPTAAAAGAPTAPSIVGLVPAGMSSVYNAWANAAPLYALNSGGKLQLALHPWSGDVHELPNDGTAVFAATSDSVAIEPVPGYSEFPLLAEGVVPIVHLDGINIDDLVLDGSTLAGIYLGEITVWNDPRIVRLNPNLNLPPTPTLPVFHRGAAPSNAVFSGYLADSDATFRNQVGRGTTNVWPVGTGRNSDSEVADTVAAGNGGIGYVDFAFAREHAFAVPQLINVEGNPTRVSVASIQSGVNLICRDSHFELLPSQEPGAWPMSAISFVLISSNRESRAGGLPDWYRAMMFFSWAVRHGGFIASSFDYAPLPESFAPQLVGNQLKPGSCQ